MQQTLIPLRHPNVMSDAERLALPDPACAIESMVTPAKRSLPSLFDTVQDEPNEQKPSEQKPSENVPFDIAQFIKLQQQRSHNTPTSNKFFLPLSQLPKVALGADKIWWENVLTQHSKTNHSKKNHSPQNFSMQTLENRLFVMGQMYHTLLCVFLLCQCKSRKTLNSQITLQDLTKAINAYAEAHATELEFLTRLPKLQVEPTHVEIAIVAIGWQISSQQDITQRTTTISANNPLTA